MGFKFVLFRLFQNLVSVFKSYHDIKPFDGRDRWIVSAAMRIEGPFFVDGRVYDDFVIVSPRHWDYSAHQQYAGFAQAFRAGRVRTTNPKWDKGLKTPYSNKVSLTNIVAFIIERKRMMLSKKTDSASISEATWILTPMTNSSPNTCIDSSS